VKFTSVVKKSEKNI